MNHLAHALLAGPLPASIVGNLMADFHKGRLGDDLARGIREGIRHHRAIDAFSDIHPVFRTSADRLRSRWRRYAPILVDLFYDHFLALDWSRHDGRPLREFVDSVYAVLDEFRPLLPPRFREIAGRLVRYDWLVSYGDRAKLATSLARVSARSRNPNLRLERAMEDLEQHYEALRADFHAFFPDLARFARERLDHPE